MLEVKKCGKNGNNLSNQSREIVSNHLITINENKSIFKNCDSTILMAEIKCSA